MGGGKKGGGKAEVVDYYMSMHYGISHSVDALLSIIVGEKTAWTGEITDGTPFPVINTELFGGNKKEGGVAGLVTFLKGSATQVMPEELALRLGKSSATCPAYRGISSVFFYGQPVSPAKYGSPEYIVSTARNLFNSSRSNGANGFMWGSNNPYLRSIWLKIRRSPKGMASDLRMVGADANPAAIIYECLTNTDWGMGASPGIINLASFEAAAQTLLDEEFGLSLQWTKQSTIEAFVSEIIDHIQATLFVNPRDGLLTLKLIRADYDPADLPVLDPDNCEITSFDRKAWGETVNEIVVTWTNPENEQEETVSAQDLANIQIQGSVISDSRNYYGVRNASLAMRLAKRDLSASSAPLATFEIEIDRSAWDFVPGGCVLLNYPEYGIDGLVLRVGKIDYGKPGQMTIKINAIEDIFGLPVAAYTVPGDTEWNDPSAEPMPMEPVRVFTAPAYFTAAALGTTNPSQLEYPNVFAAVLASDASGDTNSYELVQQSTAPNGETVGELIATKPIIGHTLLTDPLAAEAISVIADFNELDGSTKPFVGGFVFIGSVTEQYQEIALISDVSEVGWELRRGTLDTVPRAWPADTPVWFVAKSTNFLDTSRVRGEGEVVRYKLLSRTSRGVLDEDDAPIEGTTMTARPHLPSRPSNVKIDGVAFGTIDYTSSPPASVTVTWSNRNRVIEDNVILRWDESTVTPETGQTTTVGVYGLDGALLAVHDGITGTSFSLPITSAWADVVDVKVTSKRDGFESLQGHSIRIRIRPSGWGDDWGNSWGGSSDTSIPGPGETPTDPGGDPDPGGGWVPSGSGFLGKT